MQNAGSVVLEAVVRSRPGASASRGPSLRSRGRGAFGGAGAAGACPGLSVGLGAAARRWGLARCSPVAPRHRAEQGGRSPSSPDPRPQRCGSAFAGLRSLVRRGGMASGHRQESGGAEHSRVPGVMQLLGVSAGESCGHWGNAVRCSLGSGGGSWVWLESGNFCSQTYGEGSACVGG